jgi:hypothetical protein
MAPPFRVSDLPGDRPVPHQLDEVAVPSRTPSRARTNRHRSGRSMPTVYRAGRPPELQSSAAGRRRAWNRTPKTEEITRTDDRGPREEGAAGLHSTSGVPGTTAPPRSVSAGVLVCVRGGLVSSTRGRFPVVEFSTVVTSYAEDSLQATSGRPAGRRVTRGGAASASGNAGRGGAAPGRAGRPREERPPAGQRPPARVPVQARPDRRWPTWRGQVRPAGTAIASAWTAVAPSLFGGQRPVRRSSSCGCPLAGRRAVVLVVTAA